MTAESSLKDLLARHSTCLRHIIELGVNSLSENEVLTSELLRRYFDGLSEYFQSTCDFEDLGVCWDLVYDYLDLHRFQVRGITSLAGLPIIEIQASLSAGVHVFGAATVLNNGNDLDPSVLSKNYGFAIVFQSSKPAGAHKSVMWNNLNVIGQKEIFSAYLLGVSEMWMENYVFELSGISGMKHYFMDQLGIASGLPMRELELEQQLVRSFLKNHLSLQLR